MRARGNCFGITGWALGVGLALFVNPIMFEHLESRKYSLLAGLHLHGTPIVIFFLSRDIDLSSRLTLCSQAEALCVAIWRQPTKRPEMTASVGRLVQGKQVG